MKLIIAIINHDDSSSVAHALREAGYSATKLATTGGFLRMGNTTFIIGIEKEKVNDVIDIIKAHSSSRTELVQDPTAVSLSDAPLPPFEVTIGGATIFVVDVENFEKI